MTDRHDDSIAAALRYGGRFRDEILWQIENDTWRAKGFATWGEFYVATYAGLRLAVEWAERPALVGELRRNGLTQQDIATTLGVGRTTIRRDLNGHTAIDDDEPLTITTARGQVRPATYLPPRPTPPPSRDEIERRNLAELYTGMGRALQVVGAYGGYDDPVALMDRYDAAELDPPQLARAFSRDNLAAARHLIDRLTEWSTT